MTPIARPSGAIVLAHSYFLRYDAKQTEKMKPYPPLATALTAAVLREKGYEVEFFDAMLSEGVEEFEAMVERTQPDLVGIFEDNFNFLTKMCTVRMREAAFEMIRAAKRVGARVAVNGSDASDRPELYFGAGADAIILGEAETTAVELFGLWRSGPSASIEHVPGLALPSGVDRSDPTPAKGALANGEAVRRTAARPVIENLDSLPLPAWDLLDLERYRTAWNTAHGHLSWNMLTSRGCPFGCNWCAKPVFGRRYTQRSPADVAEEMRHLRDTVAPDHIWFCDDIFGLTADWIESFAVEVESRGAAIPFMIQSRVSLMEPRVVKALVQAGAEEVWLGVESGSQRILDDMQKGTSIEEVRMATRALKEAGVRTCWFIQLGYLGEEWDDILLTRDLILDERPDDIGVSVSYPLPGTKFYEMVKKQLSPKTNWTDSDELAMIFEGTYTTDFYKSVRNLLHDEVRLPRSGMGATAASRSGLASRWTELAEREVESRSASSESAHSAERSA